MDSKKIKLIAAKDRAWTELRDNFNHLEKTIAKLMNQDAILSDKDMIICRKCVVLVCSEIELEEQEEYIYNLDEEESMTLDNLSLMNVLRLIYALEEEGELSSQLKIIEKIRKDMWGNMYRHKEYIKGVIYGEDIGMKIDVKLFLMHIHCALIVMIETILRSKEIHLMTGE